MADAVTVIQEVFSLVALMSLVVPDEAVLSKDSSGPMSVLDNGGVVVTALLSIGSTMRAI